MFWNEYEMNWAKDEVYDQKEKKHLYPCSTLKGLQIPEIRFPLRGPRQIGEFN